MSDNGSVLGEPAVAHPTACKKCELDHISSVNRSIVARAMP